MTHLSQSSIVNRQSSIVMGLISGTSADGISAALVRFNENLDNPGEVAFELLAANDFDYSAALRERVLAACASQSNTRQICELNFELGETFAVATHDLIAQAKNNGTLAEDATVDLIASHGQTVWHQVEAGLPFSTLQIAEPAVIAGRTNTTVASNFRVADVVAGGQGAPLASFFDYVFFADPHKNRALQNIGGIGNVTFLLAGQGASSAWAFDTGPGNMLMDFAASHYTNGQLTYDKDGAIAATGQIDTAWLDELMLNPYFTQPPPKTTGRELFGLPFWEQVRAQAEQAQKSGADVLATLTAFTARSIARSYRDFGPPQGVDEIIVSGGGARNPTLLKMLQAEFGTSATVRNHDDFGLAATAKEAVAFALFGYELLRGRAANLPACTGAAYPVLMGQLTPGRNYAELLQRFAPTMATGTQLKRLQILDFRF